MANRGPAAVQEHPLVGHGDVEQLAYLSRVELKHVAQGDDGPLPFGQLVEFASGHLDQLVPQHRALGSVGGGRGVLAFSPVSLALGVGTGGGLRGGGGGGRRRARAAAPRAGPPPPPPAPRRPRPRGALAMLIITVKSQ